uniref:Alpha-glucan water dikinase phosphohistidine-like domain-containing protein n=1 Tax=Timspurckia oligopyrenoides TaxID=708627 RepID=A0A7S0ZES6_9RHOD
MKLSVKLNSSPVVRWAMLPASKKLRDESWMPPPCGWITCPDVSSDAGSGAWETVMKEEDEINGNRKYYCYSVQVHFPNTALDFGAFTCAIRSFDSAQWWKPNSNAFDYIKSKNVVLPFSKSVAVSDHSHKEREEHVLDSSSSATTTEESYVDQFKPTFSSDQKIDVGHLFESIKSVEERASETNYFERKWRRDLDLSRVCDVETWLNDKESSACRSLMHRYNLGSDVMHSKVLADGSRLTDTYQGNLLVLYVWLRLTALRELVWNKNYNVKPREISSAQRKLMGSLEEAMRRAPVEAFSFVRLVMSTLGTAAESDAGQRIRDEILRVQRETGLRGGMFEQWHQKLHNNASPDDIVICEAILEYAETAPQMDIQAYWSHLEKNGITSKTLLSYDRAIRDAPEFSASRARVVIEQLTAYLKTLKAVFSGADLECAVNRVLGYEAPLLKGNRIKVEPIQEVLRDRQLVAQLQELVHVRSLSKETRRLDEDSRVEVAMKVANAIIDCRTRIQGFCMFEDRCARWIDVVSLDLALEQSFRVVTEEIVPLLDHQDQKDSTGMHKDMLLSFVQVSIENVILSTSPNDEFLVCLRQFRAALKTLKASKDSQKDWALRVDATIQRLYLALGVESQFWMGVLTPLCARFGDSLGCDSTVSRQIPEETIRSGSASALGQLLPKLVKRTRKLADLGPWQLVSMGQDSFTGTLAYMEELNFISDDNSSTHSDQQCDSILLVDSLSGEADIPAHVGALLTLTSVDMLSHVSVRARNESKVLATCFDLELFENLKHHVGRSCTIQINASRDLHIKIH